jgi:hypothetical protein
MLLGSDLSFAFLHPKGFFHVLSTFGKKSIQRFKVEGVRGRRIDVGGRRIEGVRRSALDQNAIGGIGLFIWYYYIGIIGVRLAYYL